MRVPIKRFHSVFYTIKMIPWSHYINKTNTIVNKNTASAFNHTNAWAPKMLTFYWWRNEAPIEMAVVVDWLVACSWFFNMLVMVEYFKDFFNLGKLIFLCCIKLCSYQFIIVEIHQIQYHKAKVAVIHVFRHKTVLGKPRKELFTSLSVDLI